MKARSSNGKGKKRRIKVRDFWSDPEGVRLKEQLKRAETSSFPDGCGTSTMSAEDLTAMRELCDDILRALPNHGVVPWGDGWVDQKSRAYAMLPNQSAFKASQFLVDHGIMMHDADAALSPDITVRTDALAKHDHTVTKAFVAIDPPPHQLAAIQHMVQQVNEILHRPENLPHLQPYERDAVCISNLVAIQPNFHNGDDYLPLHLDNPRHDGFGVVIVTVAVWGSAQIVLVDDGDPHPTTATNTTSATSSAKSSISTSSTNTTGATPVEGKSEAEEVGSGTESTVDLSISRRASLLAPLPLIPLPKPLVCEGGIVYRNGEFIATAEPAKPSKPSTTSGAAVSPDPLLSTAIQTSATTNTEQVIPTSTAKSNCTTTAILSTVSVTCITTTTTSSTTTSSTTTPSTTTSGTTAPECDSKSWAFPLSPGQLYVLSGPARNKCAHGVVVTDETAPTGEHATGAKKQRGRAKRDTTTYAPTLPNLRMLANLFNSSATASTAAHASPIATATATATAGLTNTNTTAAAPDRQPNRYNGRVSLNFRFGLHTPDQAYEDVDRHWG